MPVVPNNESVFSLLFIVACYWLFVTVKKEKFLIKTSNLTPDTRN